MVANDHDGQVLYYRRDLLEDPQHQAAFKQKYGYAARPCPPPGNRLGMWRNTSTAAISTAMACPTTA